MSIKDKALRWWAREIQHNNHVISSDKNPEQRQLLTPHQWSLRGVSALLAHVGEQAAQKHLLVKTKDKTNRTISLLMGYEIELRHDPRFDERLIKTIEAIGARQIFSVKCSFPPVTNLYTNPV